MSASKCARCYAEVRLRHRDFSEQVLAALISWGEIEAKSIEKPICDVCYDDLRETLIDRADELHAPPAKKRSPRKRKKPVDNVI